VKGFYTMMYLTWLLSRNSMFVVGSCLMRLKWHDIDYSMTTQFCVAPAVGTKRTCRNARVFPELGVHRLCHQLTGHSRP
jgi:hypothetical protein